ncbi:amino acid adenylation domain-containing protein, partial [Pyxidicoccus sp. 3LG]
SLTYAELDSRANQLAHHLIALGVPVGGTVGLCLDKSLDMAVAVLATLKTGAAYLPLDPTYPAERLAFMLEDSGAPVVLTQSHLASVLPPDSRARRVSVDSEADTIARQPTHAPVRDVSPEATCYLIYTSGSTGRPKGVALPHRALSNLLAWQLRQSVKASATTLQFAALSFDVSFQELFSTWSAGGTLVLPTGGLRQDIPALLAFMDRHAVERLFLPFVALQAMADAVVHGATLPRALREVVTAGEQLQVTPALVSFFEKLPGCVLENQYGPSETHVVSALRLQGEPSSWPRLPSIGAPLPHTGLYVLDPYGQPCPVGVPGELFIGGTHLAHGYAGRPELTAEKFVPHPFSDAPGARLYRTGDSARWKADGTVEFLGRVDFQVKLRGFRIELGEVEAALRAAPGVRDAAAVVREDSPGDKRLVAYVVPAPADGQDSALNTDVLRTALLQRLPEYMVPSAFVSLEALPLTPSGKLARKQLPAPDAESLRGDAPFTAPRTPEEEKLASIFAEVLRLPRISVTDGFFALGGHSLLATQVISRVRSALGVELPLRTLFEAPTVAALAARIAQVQKQGPEVPPLVPVPRTGPLPLSFAQQRLWFIDQLQPGSPVYNMPTAVRLTGVLDVAALERALGALVERHESLRITFATNNGEPTQVIHPAAPLPLPQVDLSALPTAPRETETVRLATEEAGRPFDLQRGPIFRASLLRLAPQEHVLLVTMHHIVSDGWSIGVLVRELAAFYEAFASGTQPQLPPLPVQYADYAVWQRDWLRGEALEAQLGYWKRQLGGAPQALELPTDRPRPPVQTFRGATHAFQLPRELAQGLEALAREHNATLFMVLLAAWQTLLHRYSGQDDVVVGSPIAGRNRTELEGLIGFFINTLALRASISEEDTFVSLLEQVRETTLGAQAHQDVPFEKLVEVLQPPRDLSRSPLFQVMFALQNLPEAPLTLSHLTLSGVETAGSVAKFDLTLAVTPDPEGLFGSLGYNTDLFDAATAARMTDHLRSVLEAAVRAPRQRLSVLQLMSAAEQRQVLVEWNQTAAPFEDGVCIHEAFEAQALRTPDAPALRFGQLSLTYRELDARANRLAHELRALGVGPDSRVALCLERSFDLVVGLLGVMKAGGAYVPLDRDYPRERLDFMLQDSGATVLLTHSHLRDALPPGAAHVLALDTHAAALARHPDTAPERRATADNLAYVIYTSGSTGRPKGVMVAHRGVLSLARHM